MKTVLDLNDIHVSLRPIDDLLPYARNPRLHNEAQVAQIAASMEEFGWTNPVLVDGQGGVIAGHGRLLAARKLGMVQVPVIELAHLTETQKRAYVIADNQLSLNASWDVEMLKVELEALDEMDFDLDLTGFDSVELETLMADPGTIGETDPDDVPDVPEEPTTRPGDVWLLGNHRLLCGDATVASDVERLLCTVKPMLMVTDPPYGVEYDPTWRAEAGVAKRTNKMGAVKNDDNADWREAWVLFPGAVAYVWHAGKFASTVQESLEVCDFDIRSQIIWAKDRFALSRGNYHWQHEPCWYAVKGKANWAGDRKQSTLWNIPAREDKGHGHGTQKPVECMKRPIEHNSSPGQAVYDPFLGSGTTLIAAEMTGRVCYGLELDPAYCDVIVKRYEDFTGKEAKLEVV